MQPSSSSRPSALFAAFEDTLDGLAMVVAPLALLVSSLFHLAGGGMDSDEVGGVVQIFAFFLFVFAALGLTRLAAERRPRAATVLRFLLVLGCVYGAINGLGSVLAAAAGTGISALPEGLFMLLVYPGLAFPLSLVAVSLILRRHPRVPIAAAIGLVVGGALFPIGRIPDIVAITLLADTLLVLSLGRIGLRLLMTRGDLTPSAS